MGILLGVDYYPEQWPEEIWEEDMRLFKLAHIDEVTVNVFSWATLQPDEDTYDFSKLDKIMDMARSNGLKVCLATSTGAHPAWMARKHPDILRTEHNGIQRKFGSRHNSCPNSHTYRKYSAALAKKLAKRYSHYENIVGWHISNEFGGFCYCDNCEKAFRKWLKKKYGTIEELNRAWNMSFWGHTLYDFEDVVVPDLRSEEFLWDGCIRTNFQGISLDYARFNSDSMLECFRLEYDAVKKYTPDVPVTTNLMGAYKLLDYQKWARHMDFVSWDNYPAYCSYPARASFNHDLMRGIKQGKPFALMEQTPSVSNWHIYCKLKRPGVMRLWSYQAAAHGADTILFFQMRRSIGACEKYHGAVIDHVGNENTRVFREITALGEELVKIGDQTLSKELIDTIMAENGRDIEATKKPFADYDAIKEQLKTAQDGLKAFEGVDVKDLQDKIKNLNTQLSDKDKEWQEKLNGMAFDGKIKDAISAAKGRNAKAIAALLDVDKLRKSNNQDAEIKAALEDLKKDNAYLFEDDTTPPPYAGGTGKNPPPGKYDAETAKIMAAAGLDPEKD